MRRPLRIGVVGMGYWGPNLARNFNALPDSELKTVCDISSDRLAHVDTLFPSVKVEENFDALLQDPELDAIVIATAARNHFEMTKSSLLAGKHTLVEKPLSTSTRECFELLRLSESTGRVLMVGHTYLYSPAVRKIKEIVDSGELGEIRYISSRRLNLGIFQDDINVAWDLAPHDLSIILHILGERPHSINCQGSAHITPGIEDVTSMSLQFSQERSALIQSSWLDPRKVREMTIVGSKRMILYDDVASQDKIKIFDTRVEKPPHYDTFADFHYSYHYGDVYIPYIKQEEPLKQECQHFIDSIRNEQIPLTSAVEGAEIVRILEASSESLLAGGAPVLFEDNRNAFRWVSKGTPHSQIGVRNRN